MKNKLLTLFLALAASVGTIFAETYSGTCGENLTCTFDTETGLLTISGTGEMAIYVNMGPSVFPWDSYPSSIKTVIIEDGVTSIGNYAFAGCSNLTSVTIPNSVKSIGWGVFEDCSSLPSVTIPNSVTYIGKDAFYGCTSFTSITIPNSVTSIGEWAFRGCSGLTSVTINSNRIVSKSYSGSNRLVYAFGNQVQQYVIGNGVTSIGESAFSGCSGLTSVTIPNSVTSIGNYAFEDCTISKIYFSGTMEEWCAKSFRPSSISSSYTLYINGEAVTNAVIPNSVISIEDYTFYGCSGLTSVTIPNGVTSIGDYAFYNCSSLTSVTIPNSVTSINKYAPL